MADEIIKELWEIKDGMAEEFGYDLDKLSAHFQAKTGANDRRVVSLKRVEGSTPKN